MSFSYCKKDYFYTIKITTKTTTVCYLPYKLFCNFDLNEKHWNFKFCNEFLLKWMKSFCKGKLHWNIIMTVQLINEYTYNLSSRLKSSWTSVSLWLMRSLCVVAGLLVTSKRSNHGRFFFIVNKVWFRPAYNDN